MKKVVVEQFGESDVLKLKEFDLPTPGPGQVRIALTSVGVNQADIMARRGQYRISSGPCPFTPGIEGGGIIDAVGKGVKDRKVGQRIILSADAPRVPDGGTYRSHYIAPSHKTIVAPPSISNEQLGSLWLPYLTAWGCLVWKEKIKPGQFVGIPAASSGVGLAAAQIVKKEGAIPIAMTTSAEKIDALKNFPESAFLEFVVTHNPDGSMREWHRDLRNIAGRNGIDVFFDPVAAGPYLEMEIKSLAQGGTIWIYGLLGEPDVVNVTPLIIKSAALRGWVLYELTEKNLDAAQLGYKYILDGFESGEFRQRIANTFKLSEVRKAHETMQDAQHIGKLVLIP